MKTSRIFFFSILLAAALFLSACTGQSTLATSWPGVTAGSDTAYVAYNQHVYAVNLTNGTLKWAYPEKANNKISFFAAPVLTSDGQLLVGGYDNVLYSLDPETGKESSQGSWPFTEAKDRFIASPLAAAAGIFAPSADDHLYALDSTGALKWSYKTQGAQWAMPATDAACECIYVPSMDHRLYALNAATGDEIWKTEDLGGSLVGTPALDDQGILYVGTFNSEMLAIQATDGAIKWRVPTGGWVWGGPVIKEDRLYFGDLKNTFYALNTADGSVAWQFSADELISDSPLLTEDTIYFSTRAGTLYAVDYNGTQKSTKTVGGKLYGPPVLAGDFILVSPVGGDSILIAFDQTGNQKWEFIPPKK